MILRILSGIVLGATLVVASPVASFASGAGYGAECLSEALEEAHESDSHTVGVAEAEECLEGQKSVLIPPISEVIWGGAFFLVVFLIMWKWGFPALGKTLKAREEKIRSDLEAAEKERLAAEDLKAQLKKRLDAADAEARQIISDARDQADHVRQELLHKADGEALSIKERANEDAAAASVRATAELRSDLADATVAIAEKIVGRSLDKATQDDLIDEFITSVGSAK